MIKLPAVFSDNMVLQRRKNIRVWGTVSEEKPVRISIAKIEVEVMPEKTEEGYTFQALLPSMVAGGPYVLSICAGDENKTFQNVMLGEVWLAGGQSNMEMELQNTLDAEKEIAGCANPLLRFYQTPRIGFVGEELFAAEEKNKWEECTPDTVRTWSGVGYYFAKKLAEELGVVVGVIGCNWGGTSASAWMSKESLLAQEATKIFLQEYDDAMAGKTFEDYLEEKAAYEAYYEVWEKKTQEYYATHENPAWCDVVAYAGENKWPGPMGPLNEYRPAGLYESMICRLAPYTLGGVLYYQGESDDSKPRVYYPLLKAMLAHWREIWLDEKLPFLFVQLPMFMNAGDEDYKNWPLIREAQMRTYETVKNTGIAVIIDQGEFNNIHPVDKTQVGKRLAWQALYQVYGRKDIQAFGPIYRDYRVEAGSMEITFDHAEDGMEVRGGAITGFEIAGADKNFVPAEAVLLGDKIRLQSEEVKIPVYARYLWTNYAEVTLFGKNGIPLAPFRTSIYDEKDENQVRSSGMLYGTTV